MMSSPPVSRRRAVAGTWWGRIWRQVLVVVLGFMAFVAVWMQAEESLVAQGRSLEDRAGLLLLDLLLGVAAGVVYPLRRRKPLLIVTLIVAASAVSAAAFPAAVLSIVSLTARRRPVEITVVSAVLMGAVAVNAVIHPGLDPFEWWEVPLYTGVLLAILVPTGLYIGARRQSVRMLEERAQQLQREQDARVEAARVGERSRIAREMHDALAHRLSLVSLHAGALEYRTDLTSEETRTTAAVVRENARLAASDLRDVLGVLRDPAGPASAQLTRPPESALESVHSVVRESNTAGSSTSLRVDSVTATDIETLSPPTRRHLHRVVQEGLTNARKHAPGQPIDVHLTGQPDHRLLVTITNPVTAMPVQPEPVASGFGLTGLRERLRIAEGELDVSESNGSFILQAWFPWTT